MKIAFIANSAWYLKNFRSSSLLSFSSAGHSVYCMFPRGGRSESIPDLSATPVCFYLDTASVNPIKEVRALFSILINLIKFRPDVLYSFNPKTNLYSLAACHVLRIPCVPNVSGVGVASQLQGVSGSVYRLMSKFLYRRAPYVFFQNSNDKDHFVKSKWVEKDKAILVPGSGVNLQEFTPYDKKSRVVSFLMAARLIRQKGVEEYLEAARLLLLKGYECEFFLAGVKDTSKRAVEDSILDSLENEPNIHFLGHVEDMPGLLNKVDCVVLPSYYPEGVPRNLIEAAASGKIIITTNTPGCREVVVEGKNGYLVEPKSVDQIVDKMKIVLDMTEDFRKSMQQSSRVLAEDNFDENIVIEKYFEVADKFENRQVNFD